MRTPERAFMSPLSRSETRERTLTEQQMSQNARLPLWLRLWLLALEQADDAGRLVLEPRQLRETLDLGAALRPAEVSRAIAICVRRGLLAPGSTARCLQVTR
jgi:hypothetical protein